MELQGAQRQVACGRAKESCQSPQREGEMEGMGGKMERERKCGSNEYGDRRRGEGGKQRVRDRAE